jgi:hypothetical protein
MTTKDWSRYYRPDAGRLVETACRRCILRWLFAADAVGDGPLVNALCAYGRARFGPGLYW